MPSTQHEVLIELFQQRPALAAELLEQLLGIPVPAFDQARLDGTNLTDLVPTEYRADAVVVLTGAGRPLLAVAVEVQLGRDSGKRWSWPVYLATLRARLRCRVVLLVVCPDASTATWSATPLDLGHPGWVLAPLVIGPDRVPVVSDPGRASQAPELAVLSAVAHAGGPDEERVLEATLAALSDLDPERATLYHDVLAAALPEAARRHLEALLTSGLRQYRSEFVRKNVLQGRMEGREQGRIEGEADSLLTVLAARGFGVPDDVRARIAGCTDLAQLTAWIQRAVSAGTLDEVFA